MASLCYNCMGIFKDSLPSPSVCPHCNFVFPVGSSALVNSEAEMLGRLTTKYGVMILKSKGLYDHKTGKYVTLLQISHPNKGSLFDFYLNNPDSSMIEEQLGREIRRALGIAA